MKNINLNLSEESFTKVLVYKEYHGLPSIKLSIVAILDQVIATDPVLSNMFIIKSKTHKANLDAAVDLV